MRLIKTRLRGLQSYPPEFWDGVFLLLTIPAAILTILGAR